MCRKCREQHAEAMEQVNAYLDEEGVPSDSVKRGVADIHIACNASPSLAYVMALLYPTTATLLESPASIISLDK